MNSPVIHRAASSSEGIVSALHLHAPARAHGAAKAADSSALERPVFMGPAPRSERVSLAVRVSIPALLLLSWWLGSSFGYLPSAVLASPKEVVLAFLELQQSGQLREFLLASLARAGLGVSIGVSVGLTLGAVSGLTVIGEELFDPTLQMLRAVPFLAVVPLFISWFGIDEQFKVLLIGAASAFPMYAYTFLGVRSVDKKVIEAARSFGLRGPRLLVQVVLPSALPSLLMALRLCLAISVVGLIAAEQVGTTKGIGYLVLLAKQYYRQDYMVLCIVLYATLGLCFDLLIRSLERYMMPWRRHSTVRG